MKLNLDPADEFDAQYRYKVTPVPLHTSAHSELWFLDIAMLHIPISLRGYYTPYLELARFVCYLKIINTFFFFEK